MIILQQMLALSAMMLIGYYCAKKGVLDKATTKKISWLVINVANVAVILQAGLDNKNEIPKEDMFLVAGIAVGTYAILLLLAWILPMALRVEKENYSVYRVMLVFSNIGFMGMPLIMAIAGGAAVLYATVFNFLFNILIYTYGIRCIKKGSEENEKFRWKSLLNAGVISCIMAMVFFVTKVNLPSFVDSTLKNLSGLTAPLSMLVIGQSFTEFRLRELVTDVKLLIFAGIKMLLLPIIGLLFVKTMTSNSDILSVCLVMFATPVASMTAMLSQQYDGNYELASRGVALTTIISVITIPLVSAVVGL